MNEWMNLSPLGTMVLQAGVKFLYEQATAALKRKFVGDSAAAADVAASAGQTLPLSVRALPPVAPA